MAKIGVADWGMYVWYGGYYDYEERVKSIKEIGFDGIERLYPDSAEDALRRAAMLKRIGMDYATCNAANTDLSMKWTAALGKEYIWAEVLGHTPEAYVRHIKEMTKACKPYGVKVAIHNHLGSRVESQAEVENILNECPDAYLLLDTGHLAVAGGDVCYIAEKYYDRIVAYHLKSWQTSETPDHETWTKRGHFCGLGQGDFFVNNEEVFKMALRKGFDGWIFIEHDTHERDPLIDLKESLDILKKWEKEI
ncbi:MAG: TIM barrel protein [Clostridia bacterium]|nr:TIM barrel protein [Clostridia bacterium]